MRTRDRIAVLGLVGVVIASVGVAEKSISVQDSGKEPVEGCPVVLDRDGRLLGTTGESGSFTVGNGRCEQGEKLRAKPKPALELVAPRNWEYYCPADNKEVTLFLLRRNELRAIALEAGVDPAAAFEFDSARGTWVTREELDEPLRSLKAEGGIEEE